MRPMTALHEDPRVARGMERQLELRRRMLDEGARPIGWKLGLGTPAAMEKHGTTAPLVGFLTDRGLSEPGRRARGRRLGATRPRSPRSPSTSPPTSPPARTATRSPPPSAASASRSSWSTSPALEVEEILAGDIFHRHVLLGPAAALDAGALHGRITARRRADRGRRPVGARRRPGRRPRPPGVPPRRVRRDRPRRRGADHGLDRPGALRRARRRDRLPAGAARRALGHVHGVAAGAGAVAILREPSRRWRNW